MYMYIYIYVCICIYIYVCITDPFLGGATIPPQLNKRHETRQNCLKHKNLGTHLLVFLSPPIFT